MRKKASSCGEKMDILKRYTIRKSDFKKLKEQLKQVIGEEGETLFTKNAELVETDKGILFAENRTVLAFQFQDMVLPSLRTLNAQKAHLPTVTVDMGAVPYVTNGADIMAPGIVKVTPGLKQGEFVVIEDERHGKALAVGKLLVNSDEILTRKKGKVIKNIHYVNDEIWSLQL
ncbi:MAG: RNA-binding protein [Candidatus Heimdallarchaeota archaeon]|nr:RNA-binding protein [Candidatus Heimdallarchaeota archaeon]